MAKPPRGVVGYPCVQGNQFANTTKRGEKERYQTKRSVKSARKNLESNTELWKAESKYIRLEPGEAVILHFNPEKIKHVEGQFGPRIQLQCNQSKLFRQRREEV